MNSAEKEFKNRHKIILNQLILNPSTKNNILFCEKIFNDFHRQTKANKLKKEIKKRILNYNTILNIIYLRNYLALEILTISRRANACQ